MTASGNDPRWTARRYETHWSGGLPWRQLEVVDETGSTNADLLARAAAGVDIDGVVLVAEHQTAGRGRHGRQLVGGAARADHAVGRRRRCASAPARLGLAAAGDRGGRRRRGERGTGVDAGLKWPNDVLAGGGKLAGILAEVAAPQPVIVVGIGLNVTLSADEVASTRRHLARRAAG